MRFHEYNRITLYDNRLEHQTELPVSVLLYCLGYITLAYYFYSMCQIWLCCWIYYICILLHYLLYLPKTEHIVLWDIMLSHPTMHLIWPLYFPFVQCDKWANFLFLFFILGIYSCLCSKQYTPYSTCASNINNMHILSKQNNV